MESQTVASPVGIGLLGMRWLKVNGSIPSLQFKFLIGRDCRFKSFNNDKKLEYLSYFS